MAGTLDLNLLPLFKAVADAGSMSEAARVLGQPKSSVSRGVARLEAALGVQLFLRSTRRLSLTTAGAAYYEKVSPLLGSLAGAGASLPEQEEEPSGELRLTAPVDIGLTWLPGLVARLLARYPKLDVVMRLTNTRLNLVGEGLDAALRLAPGRLPDSSLVARRVSGVGFDVYASPAYLARRGTPRRAEDLSRHDLVEMVGLTLPPPFPRHPKFRVVGDDVLFCRELIREGAGLGLLPVFLARGDTASGALVRVLPRVKQRTGTLYFVHPPLAHPPRKLTALRDLLFEYAQERPLV
ncbi:MAG: LysR family transcriptional regulator [Myxococcales bacterium]|nr:LysR family transcriptional regulator [Myxococcales bacterium]